MNNEFTIWWFNWMERRAYKVEMMPEGTNAKLTRLAHENAKLRKLLKHKVDGCELSGVILRNADKRIECDDCIAAWIESKKNITA